MVCKSVKSHLIVNKYICFFVSCPPYSLISIPHSVEWQGFMTSRTSLYFKHLPVIWWPVALPLSFMKPINVAKGHVLLEASPSLSSWRQEQHWQRLCCLISTHLFEVQDTPAWGFRSSWCTIKNFSVVRFKALIQVLTGSSNCRSTSSNAWKGGLLRSTTCWASCH